MGATRKYVWILPAAQVSFSVSSASDKGLVRKVNEDSFIAVPPLFLVADGMGGHAFGDRASQETARVLSAALEGGSPATAKGVLAAVSAANRAVQAISEEEFAGTTLAGVALVQSEDGSSLHWMALNIGDSRIYSWEGKTVSQVSVDHSAVQELVDEGVITAAEAAVHPNRNVITRAVGIDAELEPDIWLLPAEGTRRFVICSDGLTKELDDRTIEDVLESASSVTSHADRLVAAALASGGADNVTVVVVEATVVIGGAGATEHSATRSLPAHLEETLPRS